MRDDWYAMYRLYAEGMPLSTIANKFKVTEAALRKKFKEYR